MRASDAPTYVANVSCIIDEHMGGFTKGTARTPSKETKQSGLENSGTRQLVASNFFPMFDLQPNANKAEQASNMQPVSTHITVQPEQDPPRTSVSF